MDVFRLSAASYLLVREQQYYLIFPNFLYKCPGYVTGCFGIKAGLVWQGANAVHVVHMGKIEAQVLAQ